MCRVYVIVNSLAGPTRIFNTPMTSNIVLNMYLKVIKSYKNGILDGLSTIMG